MIKLCFKEYGFKLSNLACKKFTDKTGLNLQTVFNEYIALSGELTGKSVARQTVEYSKLYDRFTASYALFVIINAADSSVPLDEIEDATFRVDRFPTQDDGGMSEPWAVVMLQTAHEIANYYAENIDIKKSDTSESQGES